MSGTVITITTFDAAKEAYRQKDLRQALYDAGEVIMGDVLVNLHDSAHRDRRRLENRLFRRETTELYERELFPPIIAATLAPDVAAGHAELVDLGHRLMMNLAALTAGVERPLGTSDETRTLYRYLMLFIEGATLAHYTGDRDAKRAEVADGLARFDAEFVRPSLDRRAAIAAAGEELPKDVLSTLWANEDALHLPHEVVVREVAFYLLAGAHTSATAFTRVSHNIFKWLVPPRRCRARAHRSALRAAVHARDDPLATVVARGDALGAIRPPPEDGRTDPQGVEGGDRPAGGEPRPVRVR